MDFKNTPPSRKTLSITKLDSIIVIEIQREDLKKRILGRRNCPKCNKIYNIYNPEMQPKVEGKCDVCNVDLSHRADDNEETFASRWDVYVKNSDPVVNYFSSKNVKIIKIDGIRTNSYTEDELKKILE